MALHIYLPPLVCTDKRVRATQALSVGRDKASLAIAGDAFLSALAIAGSHMLSDPPAQPIEPDACPLTASTSSSHSPLITETTCAGVLPLLDASRYFSVLPAAAGRSSWLRVWLIARSGEWPSSDTTGVVVRRWGPCDANLLASAACRASGADITATGDLDSESLAHNAAPAWHNRTFMLIGGRYNRQGRLFEAKNTSFQQRGVLLFEARVGRQQLPASGPSGFAFSLFPRSPQSPATWEKRLVISPAAAVERGCVEERQHFHGACQFDGHFSVVSRGEDEWLLFARANVARGTSNGAGGRHVQVTSASSPHGPWGRFRLLQFGAWRATEPVRPERNVYLPAVKRNPADPRTLLGLFPYYDDTRAFIGLAVSCNGWQFSELVPFAPSSQGLGLARIADHPVDGWMTRRDVVYFFVHRNVPGIASNGSSLVRHAVPLLALREYTQNATRAMPSCSHLDLDVGTGGGLPHAHAPLDVGEIRDDG